MDLCPLFDDVVVTQLDGELDVFPPRNQMECLFSDFQAIEGYYFYMNNLCIKALLILCKEGLNPGTSG
jgi:hypothetical protein